MFNAIMKRMEDLCASFPPVVAPGCRVLVLGSMPGVASLRAGQYYAHPRNAFWPILFALWGQQAPSSYEERLAFATRHGVAIWDVAKTCRREGSSDGAIRDAEPNDFFALFLAHSGIHTVLLNGQAARSLFDRLARGTAGERALHTMPSTSPAYTLPFERKLAAWQLLRQAAEKE